MQNSSEALAASIRETVADVEVTADARLRDEHATDFGRVVSRRAAVVARPRTADAVAGLLRFARSRGVVVAAQGGAHSQGGQSLVEDGILLDLRALNRVGAVEDDAFEVGAGGYWRDAIAAALAGGRVPPVLTTNFFTTVGGTHSVGGIGHASFRWGTQADNCVGAEIVTGAGEVVRASASEHPELFEHTLAGLGQLGVLTSVRHRLRPHGAWVRTVRLAYRDRTRMIAAARALAAEGTADHLNGEAVVVGGSWIYLLGIARELPAPAEAGRDPLARVAAGAVQILQDEVRPFAEWVMAGRGGPPPPRSLQPGMIRPGIDVLLPAAETPGYSEELRRLLPGELQARSLFLILLLERARCTRPLFALPAGDDLELLSVLPTVPASEGPRLLPLLAEAVERAVARGGTQYPAGWLPRGAEGCRLQWPAAWERLEALRRRFDPGGILAPWARR